MPLAEWFLWQGTLIAVAMAIVMRAASSSTVRYQWSLSALLLMAVCPIITFFSRTQPPSLAAVGREVPETGNQTLSRNPVAGTPDAAQATDVVNMPLESPTKLPPNIQLIAFVSHAEKSVWERIALLLTSLYLSGVVLLLFRLAIGLWGGRMLRNQTKSVTESYLLVALQRQATALGLKLRPALAYCEHVTVPTVMGIFRPMILLPLSLTSGLTPDQFESILAHELAHLRRFDHLVNLLQRVIESLLFFHPAVWWISNCVREEREHCCDDLVVACGAVPFDYAASLLRVAELSRPMTLRTSVAAVSLLATGSEPSSLRHRIARLLGESAASPLRLNPRFMVFAIIGPLIFVIVALQSNASNTKPASDETSEDDAVGAFASGGIDAEAAALLRWIPETDGFQQVDAMLTLAKTKDKGGNRDAARTLLALATKMALEMSVDGKQKSQFQQEELQSAALMQICRLTAEYNDASAALELAPKIISPYFRVIALCQIAERQAEANSPAAARKTLEAASAAARQTPKIREDYVATVESRKRQRAMAFESVVESLAKLRHTDAALTVIDEVATSVGTANCYSACLTLLTAEIMADNNEGRDRVLGKIIQLDEAARINPDTPVLGTAEEFLKSAYIAAADQLISIKQFDRAEKLIATVRRNPGDHDSDSWSIDSLVMRLAIQRIKEDSADVQIPTESDFLNRDSFLKFTALYGRELARNGQREQSVELIEEIVAESSHLKSDSVSAIPMIFAAHTFAILGDDQRAIATAEWIGLVPSVYATESDWDYYGLPFQAMSCQATALSLIAKAQLERNDADAAINTLSKIVIETSADGRATSWYLERVKADALVDVANWLSHHGRQNEVNGLIDAAETGIMRVTLLSRLESFQASVSGTKDQPGTETIVGTVVSPDGQPITGSEVLAFEGAMNAPRQLVQTFHSDANGQIRVPKVWHEVEHRLMLVTRRGNEQLGWFDFALHQPSATRTEPEDGSFKLMLLPMSRTVRGRILDESRKPLAKASVEIVSLDHAVNSRAANWNLQKVGQKSLLAGTVTREDGKFALRLPKDASASLMVSHPERMPEWIHVPKDEVNDAVLTVAEGRAMPIMILVPKDEVPDVKLSKAAKVVGKVVDTRTGIPIPRVTLGLRMANQPKSKFVHLPSSSAVNKNAPVEVKLFVGSTTTTDANGDYHISDVRMGEYTIEFMEGVDPILAAPNVTHVVLESGDTFNADFELSVGKHLTGRVIDDENGAPVSGCRVTYSGHSRNGSTGLETTTNDKGEFKFLVPPGRCRLDATADRFSVDGAVRNLDIPDAREPLPVVLKAGPSNKPVPDRF
jgi:beta-lactamase regulating signal transducer with metallopeptidase domain